MEEQEVAPCSRTLCVSHTFHIFLIGGGGANLNIAGSKSSRKLVLKLQLLCLTTDIINSNFQNWPSSIYIYILISSLGDF